MSDDLQALAQRLRWLADRMQLQNEWLWPGTSSHQRRDCVDPDHQGCHIVGMVENARLAADALERVATQKPNRFDCPECGQGIPVDEDGCCRTCGANALERVASGAFFSVQSFVELAEQQGVKPVRDVRELAVDVLADEKDLDACLEPDSEGPVTIPPGKPAEQPTCSTCRHADEVFPTRKWTNAYGDRPEAGMRYCNRFDEYVPLLDRFGCTLHEPKPLKAGEQP